MKKVLLGFLIIFAIWCATTHEGKMVAVRIAAFVKLNPPVLVLNEDDLNEKLSRQDIQKIFKNLDFFCTQDSSRLGDESCNSDVSIVNNQFSYNVAFFFLKGHLNAVRIAYQPVSHEAVERRLNEKYQRYYTVKNTNSEEDEPILIFKAKSGYLMTSKQQSGIHEVLVLWAAKLING